MNYEIPSDTVQLINNSRRIAKKYMLRETNTLCILLSVLQDRNVQNTLQVLNIEGIKMTDEIKDMLSKNPKDGLPENQGYSLDSGDDILDSVPPFDKDCTRILKLLVLEDKLAGGHVEGAEIILRAIMHDRDNRAKTILNLYVLYYNNMLMNTKKK
mgnify:FL=1